MARKATRLPGGDEPCHSRVWGLGKEPGDTFTYDQFPDVKFDYIMANPPFNISDWGGEKHERDPRWKFS